MSKTEQGTVAAPRQQKILDHLQGGARTWDALRTLTKLNDDNLGFAIGELLNLRKIWTFRKGEVRLYGIERRVGLAPRFVEDRRRASDTSV